MAVVVVSARLPFCSSDVLGRLQIASDVLGRLQIPGAISRRSRVGSSRLFCDASEGKLMAEGLSFEGAQEWKVIRSLGSPIIDLLCAYDGMLDSARMSGEALAAAGHVVVRKVIGLAHHLIGKAGINDGQVYELLTAMEVVRYELNFLRAGRKSSSVLLSRIQSVKQPLKLALRIAKTRIQR